MRSGGGLEQLIDLRGGGEGALARKSGVARASQIIF